MDHPHGRKPSLSLGLVPTAIDSADSYYTLDLVPGADGRAAAGVDVEPGDLEDSLQITISLDGLVGTTARLYFRLIGGSDFDQLGGSVAVSSVATAPANQAPTANAGGPYTVAEGSSVTLSGSPLVKA